jgi:hypothetical protein
VSLCDLPCCHSKALFDRILVLDIQPKYRRVIVAMPFCVGSRKLSLPYAAQTVKDDDLAALIFR